MYEGVRRAFYCVILLCWGVGTAHADKLAVVEILSEPAVAMEAGALTLILRSQLAKGQRQVVSFGTLHKVLGKKRTLAGNAIEETMRKLKADRLISGRLAREGTRWKGTIRVYGPGNKILGSATIQTQQGNIDKLGAELVRKVAGILGEEIYARPQTSVGQLRPFVMAAHAVANGNFEEARESLWAAQPGVASSVPAAIDIARVVWEGEQLPFVDKMTIALSGSDPSTVLRLANAALQEDSKNSIAWAAKARAEFVVLNRKAGNKALAKVDPKSPVPFVSLARAHGAHTQRQAAKRDVLLHALVESAYIPALAYISSLSPGVLSKTLEHAVLDSAETHASRYPSLANSLGVRAARGGIGGRKALDLIEIRELSARHMDLVESLVDQGDAAATSYGLRLLAAIQARRGRLEEAEKTAQKALAQDPQDSRLLAQVAQLQEDKNRQVAKTTHANLDTAGDDPLAANVALANRQAPLDTATEVRLVELVADLRSLLDKFPVFRGQVATVAVVPMEGSEEAFYWPLRAHPHHLEQGIVAALEASPYQLQVSRGQDVLAKPLARSALEELAARRQVGSVVAYSLRSKGTRANVHLVVYDVAAASATEYTETIGGKSLGLVSWNPIFLGTFISTIALFLTWLGVRWLKGTGSIQLTLQLDANTETEMFGAVVTRDPQPPDVGDISTFADRMRRDGFSKTRYRANMIGTSTRFERIVTGWWYVHVYGTFVKGNQTRLLEKDFSQRVQVKRNKPTFVRFDLVPKYAEFRISVFDGQQPVAEAQVWVDKDPTRVQYTSVDGRVDIRAPLGARELHIHANGMEVTKPILVDDTKERSMSVNLERERRLAQAAQGIEIGAVGAEEGVIERAFVASSRTHVLDDGAPSAEIARGSQNISLTGLDRYKTLDELGRGAMGVVYRARDQTLERDVALKVMAQEIRQHPGALGMFLQEAKALAALNHPNVVTVFDQGEDGQETYMVMEYVEGQTLADLLELHQTMSVERAIDIADQVCAGLAYAHNRRVIHRDIKPGNVFLSTDGSVKLGDFGLARVMNELRIHKTEVRGTPLYMAPEQIHGQDIDFRADLYSVGCTLFEMLAGRPPFIEGEVLYHHIHTQPPKPSQFAAGISSQLDAVVLRCLAKDKNHRFSSAQELREKLQSLNP